MGVYDIAYWLNILLMYTLGTQIVYGLLILLLGRVMKEYFEWGIFDPPLNLFQKTTNVFLMGTIGSGYYLDEVLRKYSWFKRKLYMFSALVIQTIVSVILYQVIYHSMLKHLL
ncbi:hypothetical protein [Halobacillus salinus]|uniref:hypothetical protein n=1 Tax=Halobacillus salinus TaxID=192814 RepID=UPI0009A77114|nr:hypothetical protein [Halobacillus salinus]